MDYGQVNSGQVPTRREPSGHRPELPIALSPCRGFALTVCRDYRARGVPAAAIARALEIDTATLLEWLLADAPKPAPRPPCRARSNESNHCPMNTVPRHNPSI
jgi:hypothetical protein